MKDYKICVYGICKNEEKFINRFMDSLEEIKDHIYLLDTGSTDNTVELFKERGAHIKQKNYRKFEFDKARNDSLRLVPEEYDICICLDIDDCIEPGFIKKIKDNWQEDTSQMKYTYHYTLDENDNPLVTFLNNHIHRRDCYRWKYPIHEVLEYLGEDEKIIEVPELIIRHRPDCTKSRKFYLELLEEFVESHPEDTRNTFLLAREYQTRQEWLKCIEVSHQYLKNENATFKPERCKLMTFMAKSYLNLKYYEESLFWAEKAIEELDNTRDPYVIIIMNYYERKDYDNTIKYALKALEITEYNNQTIDDSACWNGTILDFLSLAYFYKEDYDNAIKYIDMDIEQNPQIDRLKDNKRIFIEAKENKEANS